MGAAEPNRTQSPEARATWTDPALRKRALAAVAGLEKLDDTGLASRLARYETAEQTEAKLQARRKQLAAGLPPDAADIALKDATTGRVRRARGGSSRSALGSFDVSKPLGPDSILGGS